jgi:hypothetical protein
MVELDMTVDNDQTDERDYGDENDHDPLEAFLKDIFSPHWPDNNIQPSSIEEINNAKNKSNNNDR